MCICVWDGVGILGLWIVYCHGFYFIGPCVCVCVCVCVCLCLQGDWFIALRYEKPGPAPSSEGSPTRSNKENWMELGGWIETDRERERERKRERGGRDDVYIP